MGLVFKAIWIALMAGALAGAATTPATPSTTAKKKTPAKHAPVKAAPRTATGKTAAAKPGTVAARSKTGRTTRTTTAKRPVRSTQQAPTPDRYKEIQAALIDKGYLQGEATGEWGPDSVDALKRFQADENLQVDGKVGALSLIALGLGPKRLSAQAAPSKPAVDPPNNIAK
jgi:peptidoglycan hydrolase-like protein with peptidoglycan-binding domain